jgi:hypothetical protein
MASHKEVFVTSALIIMIRENMATITVRAFFSVKYFFIVVDLHEGFDVGKYRIDTAFSLPASVEPWIPSTKNLL